MYRGADFNNRNFTMASTNACQNMTSDYVSYVNNLPVTVKLWRWSTGGYILVRTLPSGGFSSDWGGATFGDKACAGSATP